ncbi:hypothetical protein TYRP_009255 [Tyrophagus putrescentiae]|nr:hypothetical protein TYRP_009255 [Tyrophagus putrescentiae]
MLSFSYLAMVMAVHCRCRCLALEVPVVVVVASAAADETKKSHVHEEEIRREEKARFDSEIVTYRIAAGLDQLLRALVDLHTARLDVRLDAVNHLALVVDHRRQVLEDLIHLDNVRLDLANGLLALAQHRHVHLLLDLNLRLVLLVRGTQWKGARLPRLRTAEKSISVLCCLPVGPSLKPELALARMTLSFSFCAAVRWIT